MNFEEMIVEIQFDADECKIDNASAPWHADGISTDGLYNSILLIILHLHSFLG